MISHPRSPRSASSTTTTSSPRPTAAMAFLDLGAERTGYLRGAGWGDGFEGAVRRTWRRGRLRRFKLGPTIREPSVVTSRVCGMRATPNPSSATSGDVRLTPSRVTESFLVRSAKRSTERGGRARSEAGRSVTPTGVRSQTPYRTRVDGALQPGGRRAGRRVGPGRSRSAGLPAPSRPGCWASEVSCAPASATQAVVVSRSTTGHGDSRVTVDPRRRSWRRREDGRRTPPRGGCRPRGWPDRRGSRPSSSTDAGELRGAFRRRDVVHEADVVAERRRVGQGEPGRAGEASRAPDR